VSLVSSAPQAEISRLLKYNPKHLFGRDAILARLNAVFKDGDTRVFALIAFGGVGKTALIAHWLTELKKQGWPGLERVFGWSFYSQGNREDSAASSDSFFSHAFEFFGETGSDLLKLSPWDKGTRLARAVAARPNLLVLDGLEPLQHPPGPMDGRLKDQAMEALLTGLAHGAGRGLCLVTSRENIVELDGCPGAESLPLEFLPEEAGAALLHSRGVDRAGTAPMEPDDAELKEASREVGGHALTLHILGLYLAKAHHGDIRKRDTVALAQADARYRTNPRDLESPYGHAFKMMAAYERWLAQGGPEGQRQLAVLRLLGLFDRPADPGCLDVLRKQPVGKFAHPLFHEKTHFLHFLFSSYEPIDEAEWNSTASALKECGLVFETVSTTQQRGGIQPDLDLSTHPVIREYFSKQLRHHQSEDWRKAHEKLFNYLKDTNIALHPSTLSGLQPLYQAVRHGCLADLYREALELYRAHILRGREFFSW
jgi:hypothetical protein